MIRTLLQTIITGLRPLFGPATCYYVESCTPFALRQLKEKNLHTAIYCIIKRVLSCNPLSAYAIRKRLLNINTLIFFCFSSPLCATAVLYSPQFPTAVKSPVYTATNCNAELIRNRAFITAFLTKLSHFIGLTPKGAPEVDWDQRYGFIGIQKVIEGGTITLTTFNRTNTLYVNLFAPHFSSYHSKQIMGFIQEHFKATGNS